MSNVVPVHSGAVAPVSLGSDDAYGRELFANYRKVFGADRLRERAVFWMETCGEHAIVRHVRDLKRASKARDAIVGKTLNDRIAARILIGNFVAGCKMTTVRWELYGDFELTALLAKGRFDPRDLLGETTREELAAFALRGVVPIGDWDFDAFIPMHQCPSCRGIASAKFVLYVPRLRCETCGREATWDEQQHVIEKIMVGYRERLRRIATHPAEGRAGEFEIQHFADPIPNSVMCWVLERSSKNLLVAIRELFSESWQPTLEQMYRRCFFALLTVGITEKAFWRYLARVDRAVAGPILANSLRKVGEALRFPGKRDHVENLVIEHGIGVARGFVPALVNRIILRHVDVEERRARRERKPRKKGGMR